MIKIFTFLLFLLPFLAFGQNYVTKKDAPSKCMKRYQKAQAYNRQNNYDKAIKELEKILHEKPVFIDALILKASLEGVNQNPDQAIRDFNQVLSLDANYSPRIYYEMAIIEQQQEKYREAAGHLEQYIASQPKSQKRLKKAQKLLRNLTFIEYAIQHPVPFAPKSLGNLINTQNSEYLPVIRSDGRQLVYTVRRNHQEDFFISQLKDSVWQKGQPIDDINTPMNEGAQCLSSDGRLLIFTACQYPNSQGSCDLYYSERKGQHWSRPKGIKSINTKAFEGQPSLSSDGQLLYFTSNRSGGLGGKDIWVSRRGSEGQWQRPENLGSPINTTDTDECPFIHADGVTLYYCSDGHPGMGKEDLFFAKKGVDNTWGKPVNLGYPINTSANEATLVVSTNGQTAYYATDNEKYVTQKGLFSNFDLFSFSLYEKARPIPVTYAKGKVIDAMTDRGVLAQLEVVDLGTGRSYTTTSTDKKGHFLFCLPSGRDYAVYVNNSKYLFHSSHFSLQAENDFNHPYLLEIPLVRIPDTPEDIPTVPEPVVLENIFFETGSATLLTASLVELNRLFDLLSQNDSLKIKINGYTDNVGQTADNLQLSEDRAKAVYDFLIKKGIAAHRLSYQGYGAAHPIADNDTELGRKRNRRTEFEMIR